MALNETYIWNTPSKYEAVCERYIFQEGFCSHNSTLGTSSLEGHRGSGIAINARKQSHFPFCYRQNASQQEIEHQGCQKKRVPRQTGGVGGCSGWRKRRREAKEERVGLRVATGWVGVMPPPCVFFLNPLWRLWARDNKSSRRRRRRRRKVATIKEDKRDASSGTSF